jgi:hypothetical protein
MDIIRTLSSTIPPVTFSCEATGPDEDGGGGADPSKRIAMWKK